MPPGTVVRLPKNGYVASAMLYDRLGPFRRSIGHITRKDPVLVVCDCDNGHVFVLVRGSTGFISEDFLEVLW